MRVATKVGWEQMAYEVSGYEKCCFTKRLRLRKQYEADNIREFRGDESLVRE